MIDYNILKKTAEKLGLEISFGDKPGYYTPNSYYSFESLMYDNDSITFSDNDIYISSYKPGNDDNEKQFSSGLIHYEPIRLDKKYDNDAEVSISEAA
ncbi:hypothetical protein FPV23_03895 [Carnobacterium sp. PL17RED31]|nr:hypothetical protein FPV23_03895 [Carnobacterium sp. PL17RED31]